MSKYARLKPCSFAIALGFTWGLGAFIMALVAMHTTWGVAFVQSMGTLYMGYKPTMMGAVMGFVWGFIDAGIFGLIMALVYNMCCGCCKKCCCCGGKGCSCCGSNGSCGTACK